MEKTTAKEGLKIVGDRCRAIMHKMKPHPFLMLGFNLFALYQLEKEKSEEEAETRREEAETRREEAEERKRREEEAEREVAERIKVSERSIERNTRGLLEYWKQDVQAGKTTMSLDEYRDYLGLNGDMKRFTKLDNIFDEYRIYDPTQQH